MVIVMADGCKLGNMIAAETLEQVGVYVSTYPDFDPVENGLLTIYGSPRLFLAE
jgi:hypothetical protein